MMNIYSFTMKELLDARDGDFIHHDKYTSELESPTLKFAYANTLVFEIKSSKFGKKAKTKDGKVGTNTTKYKIFVMFEDFYTIGRDKDISLEDAVDYAIDFADIHIRCNCPAHTYWGYSYEATQLGFLYGIPRENRFPIIRNPQLLGSLCKHEDKVIQWIFRNRDLVVRMFSTYYDRLKGGQSIYAVNSNGTTITIGHKEGDGDVFFEQLSDKVEDQDVIEAVEEEDEEPDVIEAVEEEEGPDVIEVVEEEEGPDVY